MSFQETFDISYYYCYHRYCTYCTSFSVDKKTISHNLEKKLIKVIQKIGKTIYLYKSVNTIFLLHLKFYRNFKNYHAGRLNKPDLVNEYFA